MESNWQLNAWLSGWGEWADEELTEPRRIVLGAEILPSDHLFSLGWRTVYRLETPYASVGVISPQGAGRMPALLALVPGFPPPNFPFGVQVSPGEFPEYDQG